MRSVRAGIINIPTGAGAANWERAFLSTLTRSEVFGVNESFNPQARDLYKRLCDRHDYGFSGLHQTGNPIFWDNKKFRKVSSRVEEIHGRGPRYDEWPGFNDARDLNIVVLEPRDDRGVEDEFTVINSHWVPNGNKVPSLWRGRVRAKSKRMLREEVARATDAGRVCIFMGDTNIHGPFTVTQNFKWIQAVPIDKIGVAVPRDHRHAPSDALEFSAPVDHKNGLVAEINTERR